jgi:hypothetical protein
MKHCQVCHPCQVQKEKHWVQNWLTVTLLVIVFAVGFSLGIPAKAMQRAQKPHPVETTGQQRLKHPSPAIKPKLATNLVNIQELLAQFDANRAFAHIVYLATHIGPRVAGTKGERVAAAYIADQFQKYGYRWNYQKDIPLPPLRRVSQNIIAIKEPLLTSAKYKIVVGAHYDSISKRGTRSPGANDNASGVGVMLEVARVLANVELPYVLEFVAFGAEESVDGIFEHHHYGSNYYVATYLKNKPRSTPIVGMISIDMIGVGENFYACTLGRADPFLVKKALASAKQLGISIGIWGKGKPWSDHEAFEEAGIPSVWFHRRKDPAYHTARDLPGNIKRQNLQIAGRLVLHMLLSLSTHDLEKLAHLAGVRSN